MAFGKCSEFTIPIIADVSKEVANAYGMMDPDEMDAQVRQSSRDMLIFIEMN